MSEAEKQICPIPRVAIDARWIYPRLSGIGIHTRELIRSLAAVVPEAETHQIRLLFNDKAIMKRTLQETGARFPSTLLPYGVFSPKGQRKLPAWLRAEGIEVFHSTNYMIPLVGRKGKGRGPKVVVTIHDLIPLVIPDHAPKSKKSRIPGLFPWLLRRVAKRADRIIAVSEHTRGDLVERLGASPENVAVIHNGVNPMFQPPPPGTELDPHVVYVGRFDPYKNLTLLVRAFAALVQKGRDGDKEGGPETTGLRLRVVGAKDPRYPEPIEAAAALGIADRVDWLGSVSDQDVLSEVQRARLLVLPSRYEGFGLPVIEAMACGTPVVCSRSSSLPEIAGNAAEFFSLGGDATTGCQQAMATVLSSPERQAEMVRLGLERARKFSWDRMARETLQLYQGL